MEGRRKIRFAIAGLVALSIATAGWLVVIRWALHHHYHGPISAISSPTGPADPANVHEPVLLTDFADQASLRWRNLPQGTQSCDGVIFEVHGAIRLAGLRAARGKATSYPGAVLGVPVNRRGGRIHFLQSAENHSGMPEGVSYGRIVFHYEGGEQRQFDLLFGVHGRDWFHNSNNPDNPVGDPNTKIGFSSQRADGMVIRGFHTSMLNPFPRTMVITADIISPLNVANLLLFGMTIDDDPRPLAPSEIPAGGAGDRAQIAFVLQQGRVSTASKPTLRWSAVGANYAIDFPPFSADAAGRVLLDVPSSVVESIRYIATAATGANVEGVLEKDESGSFPKEFLVRW